MAKLRRFGGTPVSEGVRLEVGKYTVFAVRNVKKDISVRMRREPRKLLRTGMRIPFLRGIIRLFRDISRFFDGIGESAELKPHRPVRGTAADRAVAKIFRAHPQSIVTLTSALLIPIILLICLWAAPEGAESLLAQLFDLSRSSLNGIVCAVRIAGALMAAFAICRLRVIRRLCMYKGALNKVINCYECRDAITIENAAQYPIRTKRSENGFLMGVLVISLIFFCLIPVQPVLLTLLMRILIVLAVAAVFNEPYSALEDSDLTIPVRIVRAPFDLFQLITTLEPDTRMLEVAVCAFNAVLEDNINEVNQA